MRDPWFSNAEAEARAGKRTPRPHPHRPVQVRTPHGPIEVCATCGQRLTKETSR